jgi:hypothetical protein
MYNDRAIKYYAEMVVPELKKMTQDELDEAMKTMDGVDKYGEPAKIPSEFMMFLENAWHGALAQAKGDMRVILETKPAKGK